MVGINERNAPQSRDCDGRTTVALRVRRRLFLRGELTYCQGSGIMARALNLDLAAYWLSPRVGGRLNLLGDYAYRNAAPKSLIFIARPRRRVRKYGGNDS